MLLVNGNGWVSLDSVEPLTTIYGGGGYRRRATCCKRRRWDHICKDCKNDWKEKVFLTNGKNLRKAKNNQMAHREKWIIANAPTQTWLERSWHVLLMCKHYWANLKHFYSGTNIIIQISRGKKLFNHQQFYQPN